jgi:bifunctional DNA-binding transcriptional regulator/antitoxin component of YhaV-PrlF toxin-antitoxin module
MEDQGSKIYHVTIDSPGRVVIPAEARRRNQLGTSGTVIVVDDGHGLHLKSPDQAIADARAYFASLAPPERILSDEIVADRRSEAERD